MMHRPPHRRQALGLMAGAAAMSVGACAREPEGVTTLDFWAMGNEATNVPKILPEFERRHPDIRVNVQALPWTAAHAKLLTAYAGDSLPE